MSQFPNRPDSSRSSSLAAKLVFVAAFLFVLLGVFLWIVRTYLFQPSQVVKLTVDVPSVRPAQAIGDNGHPVFTGTVVDAQTHQPVVSFRALIGYCPDSNSPYRNSPDTNSPTGYLDANGKAFGGGQYTIRAQRGIPEHFNIFVRIEARGYAPSISTAQKGSATVDFQLTPTNDITGFVFGIDGRPAAGVPLTVGVGGTMKFDLTTRTISKDDGSRVSTDRPSAVSAADGSHDLPPQAGSFLIVACNAGGIVLATPDDSGKSTDLHLQPWAGVEGRLMAGDNKPIAGSRVIISGSGVSATPSVYLIFSANVQTDDNGHYLFTHLPPVPVWISRTVDFAVGPEYPQLHFRGYATTKLTTLEPGKTINADHNGGREVAVKIFFPQNVANGQYVIQSSIFTPPVVPILPQMPDNIKSGPNEARQQWMLGFVQTPAGRQFIGAHPQITRVQASDRYAFQYDGNNLFHVDDVRAGDYKIELTLQQTIANGREAPPLSPQTATFTMPPITPDIADKPLVLPDITLTAN